MSAIAIVYLLIGTNCITIAFALFCWFGWGDANEIATEAIRQWTGCIELLRRCSDELESIDSTHHPA